MGTCSSGGEKVRIDYVSQILESDIPKNIPPPYTELKGIILQKGIIIKNFINYCEKKRKIKCEINEKKEALELIFKRKFKEKHFPYVRYKNYYTDKLDCLLENFFKDKDGDIFEIPDELKMVPDFQLLKNILRDHYTKIMMKKQINFYEKFIDFINSKKNEVGNVVQKESSQKINLPKIQKFYSEMKNSLLNSSVFGCRIQKDNDYDEEKAIIEKDIENLYDICLNLPIERVPLKLSQLPIQKTSFLLKLITTEFMLGGDVFLQGSLRTFVRNLYFIYIMKKYHFLSKTESFYIIDPFYIKNCLKRNQQYSFDEEELRKTTDEKSPLNGIEPDCESPSLFIDMEEKCQNLKIIYNGEYDNTNFLFGGSGTLINVEKNYCYEGLFRYGKKHCMGILWEEDENNKTFMYYAGEWLNDKKHGWGIYIEIKVITFEPNPKDSTKTKKIEIILIVKKGNFIKNNFSSGEIYTYTSITYLNQDNNDNASSNSNDTKKKKLNNSDSQIVLIYTKYTGEVIPHNGKYINHGIFKKKEFSYNYQKNILEVETDYDYIGNFVDGIEDGKGFLKSFSLSEGYTFEYTGEFSQGQLHGFGLIKYSSKFFIKQYEGFFKNNQSFYLYGKVEFKSGDVYEGFFDDKFQKDYLGLYQHFYKVESENSKKESETNNTPKIPIWKFDNYFGYFNKDKKHGLGRFLSPLSFKTLTGSYVNGEKQGCFQLTSEEDIRKEKVDDLFSYDLNSSEIEMNIVNLATRRATSVLSDSSFRKKDKNKNKKIFIDDKKPIIKQKKLYLFFENNDILDKSERPFDTF